MSGLDKMKARILEEAESSAREILENARREADAILEKAEKEAQAEAEALLRKAEKDAEEYLARTDSALDMEKKREILAARQAVIGEILDQACDTVRNLDEAAYFALMEKLLDRYVLPEKGEICFSGKDLKRMPRKFRDAVEKTAAAKGGSLTVSDQAWDIDGGFLLVYGGIQENCTLKAIFRAKRDELSDQANRLLFGGGAGKEGRN